MAEAARWWERHIAEVVYGLPPDAPPGTQPKSQYDPELHSLTAREKAKAGELAAAGHRVSASTLKHRRQRWGAMGLAGLVDHRAVTRAAPFGRADPQVVAAMRQAIAEATEESSKTAAFVIWRTGQILAASDSTAVLPPQRTSYRLFAALSRGKHTTGSASTRRSLAGRPAGMFGQLPAAAPGELMHIDSTPLDVLVLLDAGVPGRVELTGMIDVATRTVTAAVLRPSARSVDASVLLARATGPMAGGGCPGWGAGRVVPRTSSSACAARSSNARAGGSSASSAVSRPGGRDRRASSIAAATSASAAAECSSWGIIQDDGPYCARCLESLWYALTRWTVAWRSSASPTAQRMAASEAADPSTPTTIRLRAG